MPGQAMTGRWLRRAATPAKPRRSSSRSRPPMTARRWKRSSISSCSASTESESLMADTPVPELQRQFAREGGKSPYVRKLFGRIARVYDLMNHLMTGGLDRRWRRFAMRQLALGADAYALDVGTGTGDLAIAALHAAGP